LHTFYSRNTLSQPTQAQDVATILIYRFDIVTNNVLSWVGSFFFAF